MSTGNPERFPWGVNEPTKRARFLLALAVSLGAVALLYLGRLHDPAARTDFHLVWSASKTMLSGRDPYPLVGSGLEINWPYPLLLPGTSLVAAIPFTLMSAQIAALVFVFLSTFALAYFSTRESWHRLPMFVSAAFMDSIFGAQWSLVLTAALFSPLLAALVSVKPQSGLPILAGATSSRSWKAAALGSVVLFLFSLLLLPHWPAEWLSLVGRVTHMKVPLAAPFGLLAALVLFRWRRPESWLLFVAAALPQTLMWYGALMPLAIATSYREACLLSMVSTAGFLASAGVATANLGSPGTIIWGVFVCTVYLPAVLSVLRRPNEGPQPAFLRVVSMRGRAVT